MEIFIKKKKKNESVGKTSSLFHIQDLSFNNINSVNYMLGLTAEPRSQLDFDNYIELKLCLNN